MIDALSKALIKLYELPARPDDPVSFVRAHMTAAEEDVHSTYGRTDTIDTELAESNTASDETTEQESTIIKYFIFFL